MIKMVLCKDWSNEPSLEIGRYRKFLNSIKYFENLNFQFEDDEEEDSYKRCMERLRLEHKENHKFYNEAFFVLFTIVFPKEYQWLEENNIRYGAINGYNIKDVVVKEVNFAHGIFGNSKNGKRSYPFQVLFTSMSIVKKLDFHLEFLNPDTALWFKLSN